MSNEDREQESRRYLERANMPCELEERPGGGWVARKLGCVGLGETQLAAAYDLERKVELAHGPAESEGVREKLDMLGPAVERLLKRLGG